MQRKYNRHSSDISRLRSILYKREWRNLADAPDLGSGGATHGGSSPPSRTSAKPYPLRSLKGSGDRHMKANMVPMLVLIALSLMLISTVGFTQSDVEKSASALGGPGSPVERQMPMPECYYCVGRDQPEVWKWNVQNRLLDLGVLTRSDLNPESDLDYLMRTF